MNQILPPADLPETLTPRKDRIEQALTRLLSRHATRSELREVVYRYADLHRVQGTPPDVAVATLRSVVLQALPADGSYGGDTSMSVGDVVSMIVRWHTRRYQGVQPAQRADARLLADVETEAPMHPGQGRFLELLRSTSGPTGDPERRV